MKRNKSIMAILLSAVMATSGVYGTIPSSSNSFYSAETVFAEEIEGEGTEQATETPEAEETETSDVKETKENYVNKLSVKYVGGDKDVGDLIDSDELEVTATLKDGKTITLDESQYAVEGDVLTSARQKVTVSYMNAAGKIKKASVNVNATLVITRIKATFKGDVDLDAGDQLNTGMFDVVGTYKDINGEYIDVEIPSEEVELVDEYTSMKSTKTTVKLVYKNSAGKEIKSNGVSVMSNLVVTGIKAEYTGDSSKLDIGDEIDINDIKVTGTTAGKETFELSDGFYVDDNAISKETTTFKVKYENSIGRTLTASIRVDAGAVVKRIDATYVGGTKSIGDTLEPGDFKVIGTLKSEGTVEVDATDVSPAELTKERQSVKVYYENSLGKSLYKSVTVDATNSVVELNAEVVGKESEFVEGNVVKPTWFKVTAVKEDGKTKTVPSSQIICFPDVLDDTGIVTLYFENAETEVNLELIKPSSDLEVVFNKDVYLPDEKPSTDDVTVYALNNGERIDVTDQLNSFTVNGNSLNVSWKNEAAEILKTYVNIPRANTIKGVTISRTGTKITTDGFTSNDLEDLFTIKVDGNEISNFSYPGNGYTLTITNAAGDVLNGQGSKKFVLQNNETVTATISDQYGVEQKGVVRVSVVKDPNKDIQVGSKKTYKDQITDKMTKNYKVFVSSGDESVATAKINGKNIIVTGVGPGTTTIKIAGTDKNVGNNGGAFLAATTNLTSFKVTVVGKAQKPTITASNKEIKEGAKVNIGATITPSNAVVTYSSNASDIASVNDSGQVTGIKAGKATITITAMNSTKTVTKKVIITVKATKTTTTTTGGSASSGSTSGSSTGGKSSVVAPTITANDGEVRVGQTMNITRQVTGSSPTITFSSNKPAVATVDANGKVTGVKKGQCKITITAKNSAKTVTKKVTIKVLAKKATSISVANSKISLQYSSKTKVTQSLEPKTVPADAEAKFTYSKSGSGFSISNSGVITANSTGGSGTVTITDTISGQKTTVSVSVAAESKKQEVTVTKKELVKYPTIYMVKSGKKLVASTSLKTVTSGSTDKYQVKITLSDGSTKTLTPTSVTCENTNSSAFKASITATFKYGGKEYSASASGNVIKSPKAGGVALNGKG